MLHLPFKIVNCKLQWLKFEQRKQSHKAKCTKRQANKKFSFLEIASLFSLKLLFPFLYKQNNACKKKFKRTFLLVGGCQ